MDSIVVRTADGLSGQLECMGFVLRLSESDAVEAIKDKILRDPEACVFFQPANRAEDAILYIARRLRCHGTSYHFCLQTLTIEEAMLEATERAFTEHVLSNQRVWNAETARLTAGIFGGRCLHL